MTAPTAPSWARLLELMASQPSRPACGRYRAVLPRVTGDAAGPAVPPGLFDLTFNYRPPADWRLVEDGQLVSLSDAGSPIDSGPAFPAEGHLWEVNVHPGRLLRPLHGPLAVPLREAVPVGDAVPVTVSGRPGWRQHIRLPAAAMAGGSK